MRAPSGPLTRTGRGRHSPTVSALDGVDLELHRGETVGLVGESSCGKTTLGRVVLGIERLTSGSLRYAGQDISRLDRRGLRELRHNAPGSASS